MDRAAAGDRTRHRPNPLSDAGLDRLGLLRADPAALEARLHGLEPRVLAVCAGEVAVTADCSALALVAQPDAAGDGGVGAGGTWVLGVGGGVAWLAIEVAEAEWESHTGGAVRAGLRDVALLLAPLEAHVAATASALATWHSTHRYCGQCGAATTIDWAGHLRRCPVCGREHFPRTDPAVIVAVTHTDRLLLGRHPSWPDGRGSVLAGFVEPGESLEDAVAREVLEEAGIVVRNVAYHSSQPWPFPTSVMIGFTAEAIDDTLHPDASELVDARWWTRDELRADSVTLSTPLSISRRLIDDWLAAG